MQALPHRRALVVANPIAGRGRGASTASELARRLEAEGVATEVFLTGARGDARARAARLDGATDLVAVVGGDGTFGEVLSGLPRRDLALALLPLGTGNVLGRDLALASDPARALETIRAGRLQALDVARVRDRVSFLGASAGFDAEVVRTFERRRRGPTSRWGWIGAGWETLRRWSFPELEIAIDGARVPGAFGMVLVANVVNYGGIASLSADRHLDDGEFEAYLFPARTRAELLRHAARGLLARFPGGGIVRQSGRRFEVSSRRPSAVQVDGDSAGETPFTLEVEREPVRVYAPPIG